MPLRLLAVVAALAAAASVGAMPAGAVRARRAAPVHVVGVHTRTFVDRNRATPADVGAGITPAPTRTLPTVIYYPARGTAPADTAPVADAAPARGRYPLVLFNVGAPGTPKDYEVLLSDWAAHGYVVAAPQFPISSLAGPDPAAWADLPAQSKDARFVLDKVLALGPGRASIPEIDHGRIAVAGHSFGGATALSLVSRCCRDARIDAAVILAGVTDPLDGPNLRDARGPLLFVAARLDRAVQYAPVARACKQAGAPKRLLTLEDIRGLRAHVVPYLGSDDYAEVVRPAIVDFLDGYVRGDRAARMRVDRAGKGTPVGSVSRCRRASGSTSASGR